MCEAATSPITSTGLKSLQSSQWIPDHPSAEGFCMTKEEEMIQENPSISPLREGEKITTGMTRVFYSRARS